MSSPPQSVHSPVPHHEARQRYARVAVRLARLRVEREGDLDAALRAIAETAAEEAHVERVGIWAFSPDRGEVHCIDLWERTAGRHSQGDVLRAADFPAYFAAVLEERVIAAADAARDPRTAAFTEPYLRPRGIGALLDAPVRARGRLVGIVCFEHVGPPREWTPEEEEFAGSISDLVALALEAEHVRNAVEALRESEEKYRVVVETASDGVITVDEGHVIRFANGAAERVFGYEPGGLIGRSILDLMPANHRERHRTGFARYLAGGQRRLDWSQVAMPGRRRDGSLVPIELSFGESKMRGHRVFTAVVRDVTERRRSEEALRESEERFRRIAGSVSEAFWLQEPDGRIAYMSPACEQVWGVPAEQALGPVRLLLEHIEEGDRAAAEAMWVTAAGGLATSGEFGVVAREGGEPRCVHVRLFPAGAAGAPGRVVGTAADVTARRRAEDRLVHDAFHDALTGLPNRALFLDRLRHTLERCRRDPGQRFAVLLADLDHFKLINDGLGHLVGDAALVAVAQRLTECVRAGDTVARLGGDEFALLLEEVERADDAVRVAHRVAAKLAAPLQVEGTELFTTASIGIAVGPGDHTAPDQVLRSADTALYQAKDRGRAGFALFDQEMHAASVARLRLETDLRRAVERGEFVTVFQPIVELASGRVTGFEALVRWQHPERGALLPAEFIALADERGMMSAIGARVLRDACAHAARCRPRSPEQTTTVAVNLSARQLLQPDLVARVDSLLQEFELPGEALAVELTEGALVESAEAAASVLGALRDRGIRLYIDDFGTGYSSLARLHRLPIDALKIDRSFVADEAGSSEIVSAVVRLAHALGLSVVAEGVETPEQRERLVALGCDSAQGYLFARPADGARAAELLAAGV